MITYDSGQVGKPERDLTLADSKESEPCTRFSRLDRAKSPRISGGERVRWAVANKRLVLAIGPTDRTTEQPQRRVERPLDVPRRLVERDVEQLHRHDRQLGFKP